MFRYGICTNPHHNVALSAYCWTQKVHWEQLHHVLRIDDRRIWSGTIWYSRYVHHSCLLPQIWEVAVVAVLNSDFPISKPQKSFQHVPTLFSAAKKYLTQKKQKNNIT